MKEREVRDASSETSDAAQPARRIYVVGFADATGLGMFLAFSAIYLSQGIGMSNSDVGLVLGVSGAASLVGAIPIARFADRYGMRRSLTLLFVARALSYVALSLASQVWTAVLAAAVGGLLNRGIGPLIQSVLIADHDQKSAVLPLARLRTLRNAGMAVGALPTGAAVAIGEEWAYRSIMGSAAVLFVVCAAISLSLPPDADAAQAKKGVKPQLVGNRPFLWITTLFGALTLSAIVLGVGLPLWITQSTDAPPWSVSVIQLLNTVLVVLMQVRVSRGSEDPRRARSMMLVGGALAAVGAATVPLSSHGSGWLPVATIVAVVVLFTAAELYVITGATSLVLVHIPQDHRPTYLATFNLGFGAATVVGPVLVSLGLTYGVGGWLAWAVFFVLAGCASLTVPLTARGRETAASGPPHDAEGEDLTREPEERKPS